jgi:hypothetical protein
MDVRRITKADFDRIVEVIDHWDSALCRCVPNQDDTDAAAPPGLSDGAPAAPGLSDGAPAPSGSDSGDHASGDGASSADACPPLVSPDAAMADEEAGATCDGSACSAP